jgi:hypothetical protein
VHAHAHTPTPQAHTNSLRRQPMAATSHDEKADPGVEGYADSVSAAAALVVGKMVVDGKAEEEHQPKRKGGEITDTESEGEETEEDETIGAGSAATHVVVATMVHELATFSAPSMLAASGALASAAGGHKPLSKRGYKKCEHGRQKSQCRECKGGPASSPFLVLFAAFVVPCCPGRGACFRSSNPRAHTQAPPSASTACRSGSVKSAAAQQSARTSASKASVSTAAALASASTSAVEAAVRNAAGPVYATTGDSARAAENVAAQGYACTAGARASAETAAAPLSACTKRGRAAVGTAAEAASANTTDRRVDVKTAEAPASANMAVARASVKTVAVRTSASMTGVAAAARIARKPATRNQCAGQRAPRSRLCRCELRGGPRQTTRRGLWLWLPCMGRRGRDRRRYSRFLHRW